MKTNDRKIDNTANVTKRSLSIGLAPAVSLTNAVVELIKLPHASKLLRAAIYARTVTATISADLRLASATDRLVPGVLAIDATAEKFKLITNTIVALFAGVVKTKAPATAIAFSAAHVVAADCFGAILVQLDSSGNVTTKIGPATQTATQSYPTLAAAVAALPAADSGKLAIGYITIEADSTDWTATTDDLTDGSDLVAATFNNYGVRTPLTGAITPVSLSEVEGTIDPANVDTVAGEYLVVLATTNGTGALVDGRLHLDYRARDYRGD